MKAKTLIKSAFHFHTLGDFNNVHWLRYKNVSTRSIFLVYKAVFKRNTSVKFLYNLCDTVSFYSLKIVQDLTNSRKLDGFFVANHVASKAFYIFERYSFLYLTFNTHKFFFQMRNFSDFYFDYNINLGVTMNNIAYKLYFSNFFEIAFSVINRVDPKVAVKYGLLRAHTIKNNYYCFQKFVLKSNFVLFFFKSETDFIQNPVLRWEFEPLLFQHSSFLLLFREGKFESKHYKRFHIRFKYRFRTFRIYFIIGYKKFIKRVQSLRNVWMKNVDIFKAAFKKHNLNEVFKSLFSVNLTNVKNFDIKRKIFRLILKKNKLYKQQRSLLIFYKKKKKIVNKRFSFFIKKANNRMSRFSRVRKKGLKHFKNVHLSFYKKKKFFKLFTKVHIRIIKSYLIIKSLKGLRRLYGKFKIHKKRVKSFCKRNYYYKNSIHFTKSKTTKKLRYKSRNKRTYKYKYKAFFFRRHKLKQVRFDKIKNRQLRLKKLRNSSRLLRRKIKKFILKLRNKVLIKFKKLKRIAAYMRDQFYRSSLEWITPLNYDMTGLKSSRFLYRRYAKFIKYLVSRPKLIFFNRLRLKKCKKRFFTSLYKKRFLYKKRASYKKVGGRYKKVKKVKKVKKFKRVINFKVYGRLNYLDYITNFISKQPKVKRLKARRKRSKWQRRRRDYRRRRRAQWRRLRIIRRKSRRRLFMRFRLKFKLAGRKLRGRFFYDNKINSILYFYKFFHHFKRYSRVFLYSKKKNFLHRKKKFRRRFFKARFKARFKPRYKYNKSFYSKNYKQFTSSKRGTKVLNKGLKRLCTEFVAKPKLSRFSFSFVTYSKAPAFYNKGLFSHFKENIYKIYYMSDKKKRKNRVLRLSFKNFFFKRVNFLRIFKFKRFLIFPKTNRIRCRFFYLNYLAKKKVVKIFKFLNLFKNFSTRVLKVYNFRRRRERQKNFKRRGRVFLSVNKVFLRKKKKLKSLKKKSIKLTKKLIKLKKKPIKLKKKLTSLKKKVIKLKKKPTSLKKKVTKLKKKATNLKKKVTKLKKKPTNLKKKVIKLKKKPTNPKKKVTKLKKKPIILKKKVIKLKKKADKLEKKSR